MYFWITFEISIISTGGMPVTAPCATPMIMTLYPSKAVAATSGMRFAAPRMNFAIFSLSFFVDRSSVLFSSR